MTWVLDTVAEFGRQLGIDNLGFESHGVLQLQMRSGALLAVEPGQRGQTAEVLVYLLRPAGHMAAHMLRKGLAKAHFRHGGSMPVQVATRGTGPDAMLLALVRLPERSFTTQTLGQAVDYVGRWLDEVEAA
ncbi:MAG: hypothetical protein ABIR26_13705 [Ramlibacter sp.]